MKKTIALMLAALMALSFVACGGEVPEAPIETNIVTSEATVATTAPENIDLAAQAYTTIEEIASGQLYMRATGRIDYANSTLFNSVSESTTASTAQELLGYPHFIYPCRTEMTLGRAHAYVGEDGSVFVFYISDFYMTLVPETKICRVFHGDIAQFASHLEEALYNTPLVVSDPDETKAMIHDTIMQASGTKQNERTDYPMFDDAKKLFVDMSVEEVDAVMGVPHYVQYQDEKQSYNEVRFYVLSNGVLMVVNMYYTALETTVLSYYKLHNAENIMQNLDGYLVYTPKS